MEEILIGEKKYVSSKRAAKITGYAKDYIGQLCREGRVPARLVGRSWYVLESAIEDHRFGSKDEAKPVEREPERLTDAWEAPRYEAAEAAPLPQVNKLRSEEESEPEQTPTDSVEHLQNAWQAWFDRVSSGSEAVLQPDPSEEVQTAKIVTDEAVEELVEEEPEEKGEEVPIRAIYTPPLEKPTSRYAAREESLVEELEEDGIAFREEVRRTPRYMTAVRITGITLAMISAVLAVVGTGYLDQYIITNSQARIIAGVGLYNK